jgi:hypothetical protein
MKLIHADKAEVLIDFTKEEMETLPKFLREQGVIFTNTSPRLWNVTPVEGERGAELFEESPHGFCVAARGTIKDFERWKAGWDKLTSPTPAIN